MKKIIILTVAFCLCLLHGCYKDKGNYDYSDINQVEISGLPEQTIYVYKNVDAVKVTPVIKGSLTEGEDNYSYEWKAVVAQGSADGKSIFPISQERDLDYFVELPEAEYYVYLNVTDQNTGVTWRNSFTMKVLESPLGEGWLVLSDVDGHSRLDMISYSGQDESLVRDVWGSDTFAQWKGPKSLVFQPDIYQNHGIYFLSEDGTARLDNDTYGYQPANDILYELGKYDAGFRAAALMVNYMDAIYVCVTANGDVYAKNGMTYGGVYGLAINKIEGEEHPFSVAPAIGAPKNAYAMRPAVILYDQTNRRFVQMLSNQKGMRMPTAPETVFKYNTGRKFVFMGSGLQDGGCTFTILKDDDGTHWLYGMKVQGSSKLEQLENYYYRIDAPDLDKATAFAVHPLLYHLFYAVGDTIHQFDMVNKKHRVLPMNIGPNGSSVNRLEGEQITMLKFNIFGLGTYSKPANVAAMENYLMVGSHSVSGGELSGKLRMLEIPTATDRPAVQISSYSGFGKVLDITYRERR